MSRRWPIIVLICSLMLSFFNPTYAADPTRGGIFDLMEVESNAYAEEKGATQERWGETDKFYNRSCGFLGATAATAKLGHWVYKGGRWILTRGTAPRKTGRVGKVVNAGVWFVLAGSFACIAIKQINKSLFEKRYGERLFDQYLSMMRNHNSFDALRTTLKNQGDRESTEDDLSDAEVDAALVRIAESILDEGLSVDDIAKVHFSFLNEEDMHGLLFNIERVAEIRAAELDPELKMRLQEGN